jgi:hypothetical protein
VSTFCHKERNEIDERGRKKEEEEWRREERREEGEKEKLLRQIKRRETEKGGRNKQPDWKINTHTPIKHLLCFP